MIELTREKPTTKKTEATGHLKILK